MKKMFIFFFLLSSLFANAQFEAFKSKGKYNLTPLKINKKTRKLAQMDDEYSSEDYSPPVMDDGSAVPAPSTSSPGLSETSTDSTFGTRTSKESSTPTADSKKYVHLNPETGYGPEVIESFDFPNASLMEVTKHIQKLTGLNLLYSGELKGKVSISAPTAITVGDAWQAYLSALNMNGYTIINAGSFYRIVELSKVKNIASPIYMGDYTPKGDRFVMKIIKLKHTDAAEIAKSFGRFKGTNGQITPLSETNSILIADVASNVENLVKIIDFLDVPGYKESMHIIKVKNTSASDLAKLLEEIIQSDSRNKNANSGRVSRFSQLSSSSSPTGSGITKIIAEPRTNSIIALATAAGAEQLNALVKTLDVDVPASGTGRIHVYYLKHGNSEELSKTLQTILESSKPGATGERASRFSRLGEGNESSNVFNEEVKITSDKNNNALVVTASATDWLTVKTVLDQLDIPKDQVLVEGMVIDTNYSKNRTAGFQWVGATANSNSGRISSNVTDDFLTTLLTGLPQAMSGLFASFGIGSTIDVPGQNGTVIKTSPINLLLKALASDTENNVLATPKLMVLDNGEGTFEANFNAPYTTTTQVANAGTSTTGVAFQEIPLQFKIKPQINKESHMIKMEITSKIADITTLPSGQNTTGALPVDSRLINTTVIVRDQDTLVMGGLLRDKDSSSVSKVPFLGDIPILGWLFKSKTNTTEKRNILFFITPTIVSPYASTAANLATKAIEEREEVLKSVVKKGDPIPLKEKTDALKEKLARQKLAPLYDVSKNDEAPKKEIDYTKIIEELKE